MGQGIASLTPIIAHMGAHSMGIHPLIRSAYSLGLDWPLISGYAYGSPIQQIMISLAYGKNSAPTTRGDSLNCLVAFRHNPPPIDSPILRWTIRGMTIADQIRNPDPPWGNHQHPLTDKES
jgi:hypothetical protein